jgi:inosine-uridine nucleoside N-ribohydrolase
VAAPRPILFDTDIGSDVDDALALGLILASPEALELVAVTTVAADVDLRARIAAQILAAAGRLDVQVHPGESAPLLRPRRRFSWFNHESRCLAAGLSAPESLVSGESAPECMVRAAREVPGLEIVLVGPMTNLARALALDPRLPERVAGITIMGGHVRRVAIGDFVCAPGIDYNLCSDPEASVAVLGAGFRTTLVSADVTLQVWLERADLARLRASGPVARLLAGQVAIWEPVQRKLFGDLGGTVDPDNVAFLHDPLTVWSLVDPSPLVFEDLRIVATIERGVLRTLEVDSALGIGAPMRVATAVDARRASRAIADRLLAL